VRAGGGKPEILSRREIARVVSSIVRKHEREMRVAS
jgi:hypothetical protein